MDLRLSTDPYESFRIFQGRILEQYLSMTNEFNFLVIDANQTVEAQQNVVRELITNSVDLAQFKREENYIKPQARTPRKERWKEHLQFEDQSVL